MTIALLPGSLRGRVFRKSFLSITLNMAFSIRISPSPLIETIVFRPIAEDNMAEISMNILPPAWGIGLSLSNWKKEMPNGLMASVIICWWPIDANTWFFPSLTSGTGYRVVIGRL